MKYDMSILSGNVTVSNSYYNVSESLSFSVSHIKRITYLYVFFTNPSAVIKYFVPLVPYYYWDRSDFTGRLDGNGSVMGPGLMGNNLVITNETPSDDSGDGYLQFMDHVQINSNQIFLPLRFRDGERSDYGTGSYKIVCAVEGI